MRLSAIVFALLLVAGSAFAANPTVVISATGTTNNNNQVVFTFQVNNGNVSAVTPVAELTINGNVIQAANYATAIQNGVVTVTVTGQLVPGTAPVKVKANLNTGGTVEGTKDVDFKQK